MLDPTYGRQYVFVARAQACSTAYLKVILYTRQASYELTLPSFKIDRPSERRAGTFRSTGVLVEAPPGQPFAGAPIASIGTSCGASPAIVGFADRSAPTTRSRDEARFLANVRNDAIPAVGALAHASSRFEASSVQGAVRVR